MDKIKVIIADDSDFVRDGMKILLDVDDDFEVLGSATLGLAEGSGKSLAIAGEALLYLNRNGICLHKGGLPTVISKAFGNERYKNAVAGSDGLKYYVSMTDQSGGGHFFVYDTQRGLWHEEDDTKATHFAYSEDRKSTRLNSSHSTRSRMPSSA